MAGFYKQQYKKMKVQREKKGKGESLDDGMLEVDRDGRVSYVPDFWLRLLYVQVVSRSQSSITCSGGIIQVAATED